MAPLILCYHALSADWNANLSVAPERLEAQLAWARRKGYEGATFTAAVLGRQRGKAVVVTFDDAFRSVFELAAPILERHGMPGTVFVPTDAVARTQASWPGVDHWLGGPHEAELSVMRWDEISTLRDAGWEIGSHSVTHPRLPDLGQRALREELARSREEIEDRLGARCTSLAYPYGAVDDRVVAAARAAGYVAGAGLPARMHRPEVLNWPRLGVYHRDHERRFALKVSPVVQRLRNSSRFVRILAEMGRAPDVGERPRRVVAWRRPTVGTHERPSGDRP